MRTLETPRTSFLQRSLLVPALLVVAAVGCSASGDGGAAGGTAGVRGGAAGSSGAGGAEAAGTAGGGGVSSPTGEGGAAAGGPAGAAGAGGSAGGSGGPAGPGGSAGAGGSAGSGGSMGGAAGSGPGARSDGGAARDATVTVSDASRPAVDPSGSDLMGGPPADPAAKMKCSGTAPIHCAFGGPPGNYDISFEIGGPAAAKTGVYAESNRRLVPELATAAGVTKRFTFTVNVRQPEGEPVRPDQSALPADAPERGTPGLDLYFDGAAPALASVGYAPATALTVLYIAGDSTVTDQFGFPNYAGWGQMLAQHFHLGLSVANYADSGESSASVLANAKLFPEIIRLVKPNDYVFIQVGHNDKTITSAAFHANITSMVTQAKAKSALPVLVTPIARADFSGNTVNPQHIHTAGAETVDLPQIIRTVATEQSVPLIDLTATTSAWLAMVGPAGWQAFHATGDATHTDAAGADINAVMVRDAVKRLAIRPLIEFVR